MGGTTATVTNEAPVQETAAAKRKRLAAEKAAAKEQAANDTPAAEATVGDATEEETPKVPKVKKHRIRKAFTATGRGLHATGKAVIDTDLRDIGQGTKRLGRKVKDAIPVRIERVHDCGNDACPHSGTDADA